MPGAVIVDVFVSVDGWAGGAGLPAYFGYGGAELATWIEDELARPQTVLLGRRTYEALAGLPVDAVDDATRATMSTDKIVFSRTLSTTTWPRTRIVAEDAAEYVRRTAAGSDVALRTMGSLSVARHLLDAGLVDRLRLMTFPLVAGPAGREPFFAGLGSAALELAGHRVLDGRVVLTEYVPTGHDIPRA